MVVRISSMKLFVALAFSALLPGVNSAVTFYNDRDQYFAALGNTNIIEATASRTQPTGSGQSMYLKNQDFEQCGLSFQWGGDPNNTNMQMRYGQHTGDREERGDVSFAGGVVWWFWLKDNPDYNGFTIATDYPFYAMGFDLAGGGGGATPQFGIKIFDEDVQYKTMPQLGSRAQFFGWISDDEPVNSFEITGLPNSGILYRFAFTNVAYATRDDQAVTSVGCYNKNPASRSCWATGWGDPHLITWDGLKYDVHAKGEVVMTRSMDSGFEIQARLQGLREPSTAGPAVTTGIVVKDPGFPTLQVNIASTSSATTHTFAGCPIDLYVNNQATDISTWEGVQGSRVILNDGAGKVIVEYVESNIRIDMRVKNYRGICLFSVDYFLADCYHDERLIGLLGSPDGDYSNDWMTQSNQVLPLPNDGDVSKFFFADAYNYSVDNWCLRNATKSFFSYESGENFYTYAHCGNAYDPTLETILNDIPAELDFCNGDIGCILDGIEIGTDAAQDYEADPALERPREIATDPPTPAPTPPPTPEGGAGSNGDPHFKTWTHEHFEFHGQCDMVLVSDPEFADGIGIEVQIRTKMVRFWSYIKTASILIGNDILEVEGSADPDDHEAHYWFNFEYQGEADSIGGFPLSINNRGYKKRLYEIDLGSKFPGQKIVLSTFREFVAVDFKGSTEESFGKSVGMFGNYRNGQTVARDGVTVINDFTELGNEWQVLPADRKLFHSMEEPQFPRRCLIPEDPRGDRRRRLDESGISVEAAEAECRKVLKDTLDIKDCVYDILATQDMDMVGAF